MADLRPLTRQFSGRSFQHGAYVVDRETGKIVAACSHRHTRRGKTSGAWFAQKCAEKMTRRAEKGGE